MGSVTSEPISERAKRKGQTVSVLLIIDLKLTQPQGNFRNIIKTTIYNNMCISMCEYIYICIYIYKLINKLIIE